MTVLVADIGATHARFALAEANAEDVVADSMMVAGIATLEDALARFLEAKGVSAGEIEAAVLAAAGPVRADGTIRMTNCPWVVDPAALKTAHNFARVRVLNDMTAAALGLLRLAPGDVEQIGGAAPAPDAPKAILAPGTGLGVSGLIPCGSGDWTPLASEGGHVDLAPHNDREIAIVFHLLREFGHASPERVLSGLGLETLYKTLSALDGSGAAPRAAVDIAGAARRGEAQAVETISLFCGWLGAVAGDLALTLGARGGVYVAGGIVPQWGGLFDRALFRRRFAAKGRFAELLEPIPAFIVKRGGLALLGCLEEARRLLR
jgi:glucokinase